VAVSQVATHALSALSVTIGESGTTVTIGRIRILCAIGKTPATGQIDRIAITGIGEFVYADYSAYFGHADRRDFVEGNGFNVYVV